MNEELIKNVDSLVINYISLKTMNNERISESNPIYVYYIKNIIGSLSSNSGMFDLFGGGNLNDIANELYDTTKSPEELFRKIFSSKNSDDITTEFIQTAIEISYRLYSDLDNINNVSEHNDALPAITSIIGEDVDMDGVLHKMKDDFKKSFLYIVENTDVNTEEIRHIKVMGLKKQLDQAIKNEKYMEAARLRDEIISQNL